MNPNFIDAVFQLHVYKNLLNITDEMKKDKTRIEDIDKIKYFQYLELQKVEKYDKMGLNDSFLLNILSKDDIAEQIKILEIELDHILSDKEKLKTYTQAYVAWRMTHAQYWEEDDLVYGVQKVFETILNDIPQEEKVRIWNQIVDKYVSFQILKESIKDRVHAEIRKYRKDRKKG